MKIEEIISVLENVFPPQYQEGYDNAGIQILAHSGDINSCLVTLDVTEDVVNEAIRNHCGLILSHHPLIFGKGLMRVAAENYVQRIVALCIKNGISVYSAHTNCDAVLTGTIAVMCKKLQITDYQILQPAPHSDGNHGGGAIGMLPQEIPAQEFLLKVKNVFNCGAIRYTQITKPMVRKIALCPGSGSFLLSEAIAQNADVFISGDFTYHKFFDADGKILLIDIGHYESENGIKQIFSDILTKNFSNFAVKISDTNTNPIKYL